MDDRTKAAYASASDSLKQVLALSTALLGFEITFAKDFLANISRLVVYVAWGSLFISIVTGVFGLLAITGRLGRNPNSPQHGDIYKLDISVLSGFAIWFFLIGIGVTIWMGIVALPPVDRKPPLAIADYPFYWAPYLAAPALAPVQVTVQPQLCPGPARFSPPQPRHHQTKKLPQR